MAKLYSLQYLRRIHKEGKANNGVIYQTEDDRIEEMTDVTLINEHNEVTNVIEADLTAIEARVTTLEQTKADKCYALAMSIIL